MPAYVFVLGGGLGFEVFVSGLRSLDQGFSVQVFARRTSGVGLRVFGFGLRSFRLRGVGFRDSG
jgi:hypothetical protein